jgi:sulfide:quinone oxidoreductase
VRVPDRPHVVILGAGFAGLELAAGLSESLGEDARVTLIDRSDAFNFGFAKLDVLFGHRTVAEIRLPYSRVALPGVEFRQELVEAIDPAARRVRTDRDTYDADILAVALGADYDFDATPGFAAGGYDYYTVAGAERLRDVLPGFDAGRIVIGILGHPYKCPPAPFEGALLLHDHLLRRGVREECELTVVGPMAAPVPVTPEVSRSFLDALHARGIEYVAKQRIVSLDPDAREAHLASGETIPYDLFIGVPVHRVPAVVQESGLAVDGWVPVDRARLTTRFPGVYAVGDLVGLPMAKAGVFAEAAARVVTQDIVAHLRGGEPPAPYEGAGSCYLEFGGGAVAAVHANFLGGPHPTAELLGPSQELAAEKAEFGASRAARWFGVR